MCRSMDIKQPTIGLAPTLHPSGLPQGRFSPPYRPPDSRSIRCMSVSTVSTESSLCRSFLPVSLGSLSFAFVGMGEKVRVYTLGSIISGERPSGSASLIFHNLCVPLTASSGNIVCACYNPTASPPPLLPHLLTAPPLSPTHHHYHYNHHHYPQRPLASSLLFSLLLHLVSLLFIFFIFSFPLPLRLCFLVCCFFFLHPFFFFFFFLSFLFFPLFVVVALLFLSFSLSLFLSFPQSTPSSVHHMSWG